MGEAIYKEGRSLIKVENVSLILGGNQILKDVNAEIKDLIIPGQTIGQVVGFLGPSGIGKTKLFEVMAGLINPTSGQVLINGKPVKVGDLGVVQQNYPLFNHRTVLGNLEIAAKKNMKDAAARKSKIDDYLNRFRLKETINLYPAQLSGGQRQRVAIIQQLLCSEHFLLLDEPFSGLDTIMVEEVCQLISEIAHLHEDNTIIIVSHDIVSTASISDTLWLMGRDKDEKGNVIPGSKIKYTYNLIEKGLAWQKGIHESDAFNTLIKEVKNLFPTL